MRSGPRSRISFDGCLARRVVGDEPGYLPRAVEMNRSLQIAVISTDYPPLRTSAAVQLRDLTQQFAALGHRPVMIVPSLNPDQPWKVERLDGVDVLRVAAPPT